MYQPLELLMIGGAAIGAFVVGNSGKTIKATLKAVPSLFQGSKYPKATYMELMALLYEILDKTRKESLLERDIESPKDSPLFKKYPKVIKDHHMIEFITDYLRLMVSGKLNAIEIEALMDREIDKGGHHGCAWKIAYADFVTAMMAFFLLMWLIGSTAEGRSQRHRGILPDAASRRARRRFQFRFVGCPKSRSRRSRTKPMRRACSA
jgi:chemotaxis protein MotA